MSKLKTTTQNLKLYLIAGILIILSLTVYGYFNAVSGRDSQKQNNSPKIDIKPQTHDFGGVSYGETAKQIFKIKNSGEETLEITRVSTSCGCTKAEAGKKELAPKEETDLSVTYDTGAMTGAHARGRQERIIFIKSNDPVNPQAEVKIYANVK